MNNSVNTIAIAVLAGWVPAIFMLFALMGPRRAVITAFVVGYLFLPESGFRFATLPEINKVSLTPVGVILASLVFDGGRLFAIRPRLIDLAWLVLCTSPIATSLTNNLGLMDGLANSFTVIFSWGLAYWIGRAYFTDWEAARDLAVGIVLGALAYAPLCWWEMKMSPMLHGLVYGLEFYSFRTDNYVFGIHLYGFRPNVFLSNGLTVTMFMGVSSVIAFGLYMAGAREKLLGVKMRWIVLFLVLTTFFCKAMGGIFLMLVGLSLIMIARYVGTKLPVLLLIFAAPVYVLARSAGSWSGDFLLDMADAVSHRRAESLEFRLKNEDILAAKAMEQPVLGWGGWNRSHVLNFWFQDTTISDGLWIILLGEYGLVGLGALVTLIVGAAFLLWVRIPTRFWNDPACASAVALMILISLYMVDSLFNATFNPIASITIGAVVNVGALAQRTFTSQALRAARAVPAQLPRTAVGQSELGADPVPYLATARLPM
jgi:hypothetical protein